MYLEKILQQQWYRGTDFPSACTSTSWPTSSTNLTEQASRQSKTTSRNQFSKDSNANTRSQFHYCLTIISHFLSQRTTNRIRPSASLSIRTRTGHQLQWEILMLPTLLTPATPRGITMLSITMQVSSIGAIGSLKAPEMFDPGPSFTEAMACGTETPLDT